MANILDEVDVNVQSRLPSKTIKTADRRKTRVLSPPVSREKKPVLPKKTVLNTPPLEPAHGDQDDYLAGMDDEMFPPSDPIPSSPTTNAVDRKHMTQIKAEEEEDEDSLEVAQAIGDSNLKPASINISGARPAPKIAKPPAYPSPESSSPTRPPLDAVDASSWNDVTSKLNVVSSQEETTTHFGKVRIEDVAEDDGSVRFFWTDYTEVNGSLCLFGKVKEKGSGTHVSAFVKVDNILRKLYFLPRTHRQSKQGKCFGREDTNTEQNTDGTPHQK